MAVTNGKEHLPSTIDFSVLPGIREMVSPPGLLADELPTSKLDDRTMRCLLALARLTFAYTNEIARYCLINEAYCLESLRELESLRYIEHCSDPLIDFHLMTARQKASMGSVNDKDSRPYWRIRRPGVSAACAIGVFLPEYLLSFVPKEISCLIVRTGAGLDSGPHG